MINTFADGNSYWVTFTSVIGPIGLVRILIFPQWWEQDGLYLERAKKRASAAAESDREETIGKE